MDAIFFTERNQLSLTSLPDPRPDANDVVIEVRSSGICHTDLEVLSGNYGSSAFPVVPGHEYAGVVVDKGPEVDTFSVGDRVVVDPNFECGICRECRRGWAHLCRDLNAYGVTVNGGFSQFSVVSAAALHPIGDMAFPLAALAEPMGCVLNGVDAVHDPVMENALIFGAGPMGLLLGIALRLRGIDDITFSDLDETRLDLAASFGFAGVHSRAAKLDGMKHGVDLAIDATGVPSVAAELTGYIANGGKGLFFGVCPAEARIEISPFEVFRRQLTLAGTHSLNHNMPAAIDAIAACGPEVMRLVSHQLPLADIADVMRNGPPAGSLKIQATISPQ